MSRFFVSYRDHILVLYDLVHTCLLLFTTKARAYLLKKTVKATVFLILISTAALWLSVPEMNLEYGADVHGFEEWVALFVCWVICFQVASILAAYLRYTRLRDPNHPRLGNR